MSAFNDFVLAVRGFMTQSQWFWFSQYVSFYAFAGVITLFVLWLRYR